MLRYLPTFYEDPFLKYRPFPAEDSESHFSNHWHEIVFMVAFYVAIQSLSPIFSRKFVGPAYTSMNEKSRINFDIHVVSMVQCVISLGTLLPMWNHEFFQNRHLNSTDAIFGYYPYGGLVGSCASAYFIWDTYVCLKHFKSFGMGFLVHGVAALWVFGSTLRPFCLPYIPAFLIFEASTPFVNINWFASRLPEGTISNKVVVINGLLLLFSFFSVRILWGFYAVVLVATDFYRTLGSCHVIFPIITLVLNVALDVLNLFWFYKMLMIAKKKISGKKNPKQLAKEAADKID